MDKDTRIADDRLRGVDAIAQEIGENHRRTYYLLEKGRIKAVKIGGGWVASRDALRRQYRALTGADDAV